MRLAVSEFFGPTIQGEGPTIGQPAMFLRLAGCNLRCSWCDTKYTWEGGCEQVPVDEIIERLRYAKAHRLVITGGEPMLQQNALVHLVAGCVELGYEIEIETNGTIEPCPDLLQATAVQFNVSPKLRNSGNGDAGVTHALMSFSCYDSTRRLFKFVAQTDDDLGEIALVVREYALRPVYIMPRGVTASDVIRNMQAIVGGVISRGWYLTPRLHTLIWGNERGR